jgi:hypothetical protein
MAPPRSALRAASVLSLLLLRLPPSRASATTAAFASASALRGGAVIAAGRAAKSPRNPLLVQDQPWERRIDNGYPNVVAVGACAAASTSASAAAAAAAAPTGAPRPRASTSEPAPCLRLWYGLCLGAESNASACSPQALAYAESADGLAFVKPELGLLNLSAFRKLPAFLRAVGTRNNLVMVGGGLGVARDARVAEGSPGAFRAFGEGCFEPGGGAASGGIGGGCVAGTGESADGLTWGGAASVAWPPPQRYDCHQNLFLDAGDGASGGGGPRWVLTTRSFDDSPGGVGREVSVVASANSSFGGWPGVAPVVARGNASEQLYSMITWRWLDVLLGIVMVSRASLCASAELRDSPRLRPRKPRASAELRERPRLRPRRSHRAGPPRAGL